MADSSVSTQARIIAAARSEFAQHGLAGARIDRIAKQASASKERLYAYYSDKRELFLAVLELNMREFATSIVLTDDNVPAFAGSLFDLTVTHANHMRMMDWARLELDQLPAQIMAIIVDYRRKQIELIQRAQAQGLVDRAWPPEQLMSMIFGLSAAWVHEPGSVLLTAKAADLATQATRRASVTRAIERLIAPVRT